MNVTINEARSPGLWNLDYLITCFADDKVCVSFGLWLLSFLFWITSSSLHFYLRCQRKSMYPEIVSWNIYAFFGSMCNTIGALLSKQLTIQVITGGYMALADIIHFILTLFPVCNSKYRPRSDPRNSKKRKKHKAILSALSISLFLAFGCFKPKVYPDHDVLRIPQRRLLGTLLQESTDVVGFTLGIIAVVVSWTVRIPVITKVCRGMAFPILQIWAVLFSVLASIMYAAAIMSHDCHPEYFVKAIPWFLISMGAAAMDVALIMLSCIMKNKLLHQMGLVVEAMGGGESCELLAHCDEEEEEQTYAKHKATNGENSNWAPLKMIQNRSQSNKPSIERFVRLSIEQVQEVGIGAVRFPGDGQTSTGNISNQEARSYSVIPVYPPANITITQSCSQSSSEASSINNELEWDFEDLNQHWNQNLNLPNINPNDSSVLDVGVEK
ncbi:transmembrane protein 44 [Pelodytes ibericus]